MARVALPAATIGPRAVQMMDYDFGIELFDDGAGSTWPMHVRGSIQVPTGDGPLPVLGFVHGYHGTCSYPLLPQLPWYYGNSTPGPYGACPDASPIVEPAGSFRGYDYLSGPLARHGYAILSADASEQNDNDFSSDYPVRAQLLLRGLDHLRLANEGQGPAALVDTLDGRLDFSRVGIMGHSRGGGAVAYAFEFNAARPEAERHGIVAVLGLAPVLQGDRTINGAAYLALLPYCDGDVWGLSGAVNYDRSRFLDDDHPKYQILVMGSNHNFYNTVWANNANDAAWMTDPYCGRPAPEGGFLSLEDTLRHSAEIHAAFFRAHVGGETEFLPFLRGEVPLAAEACPAADVSCDELVHVSYHPGVDDRLVIEDTRTSDALTINDLGGTSSFEGFRAATWCRPIDCPSDYNTALAPQLHLAWEGLARWTTQIPADSADLSRFDWIGLRVGVNDDRPENERDVPQDFRIRLIDTSGASADVRIGEHTNAAYYPPGDGDASGAPAFSPYTLGTGRTDLNARVVLNEVRVPLSAFSGVDLANVAALEFVFDVTRSGSIQVTDLLVGR